MPTTVPGFLLMAGTAMILLSCVGGGLEIKELKLPELSRLSRSLIAVLGIIFLGASALLYTAISENVVVQQNVLLNDTLPAK
jgi:hypothetical protein